VVVDDDDFEGDTGLDGKRFEAGGDIRFFVARGNDDGDGGCLRDCVVLDHG
jgi:hypothetical protein